jgi:hypothetical protein
MDLNQHLNAVSVLPVELVVAGGLVPVVDFFKFQVLEVGQHMLWAEVTEPVEIWVKLEWFVYLSNNLILLNIGYMMNLFENVYISPLN